MLLNFRYDKNNPPSAFTKGGPSIVELQTQLGEGYPHPYARLDARRYLGNYYCVKDRCAILTIVSLSIKEAYSA